MCLRGHVHSACHGNHDGDGGDVNDLSHGRCDVMGSVDKPSSVRRRCCVLIGKSIILQAPFERATCVSKSKAFGLLIAESLELAGIVADENTNDNVEAYYTHGTPVLCTSVAMAAGVQNFLGMEYYGKSEGWVKKLFQFGGKDYAVAAIIDKAAHAQVDDVLKTKIGLDPRIRGSPKGLGEKFDLVFEIVICTNLKQQNSLGMTHFCLSEARLLVKGSEIVVGWRYSDIPGHGFSQKLQGLQSNGPQQAIALAKKIGFVCNHSRVGSLLVIPAGFMIASVTGSDGSEFLRWAFSSPSDSRHSEMELADASASLKDLMVCYPSLQKGLHSAWQAKLDVLL